LTKKAQSASPFSKMSSDHLSDLKRQIMASMQRDTPPPVITDLPPPVEVKPVSPVVIDVPQLVPQTIPRDEIRVDVIIPPSDTVIQPPPVEIPPTLAPDFEYQQLIEKYNQKKNELAEIEENKKNKMRKRQSFPPIQKKKKKFEDEDSESQQELMKWQKIAAQREKQLDENKQPLLEREVVVQEMSLERVSQMKDEIRGLEEKIKNDTKEQYAEELSIVGERKQIQDINLKKQDYELKKRALQSQINALNDVMSSFEREEMQHLVKIKNIEQRIDGKKTNLD
jgi:hypothetical protein